jgi:hypothetical protein
LESDAEIVISVSTASELRIEVALANTPEELRDNLRARLKSNQKLIQQDEPISFHGLAQVLRDTTDQKGVLTVQSLQPALDRNGDSLDAQDLIDMAESQGMLVRLSTDCWQLLE